MNLSILHSARNCGLSICIVCIALFTTMSASADPPAGYYDSAAGLSGTALKDALHNIIKGHTVIPYSSSSVTDVSDALKVIDEDPNNTNNVLLWYKGNSVAKSSFGTTWNREHTWPQSLGAGVSPKVSDLHHIAAEDASLNSSRGNSVFNVVPNPTNSYNGNRWTGAEFEVRDARKGDIARCILYMDVRYDGTGGETDLSLVNTSTPGENQMAWKDVLIQWSNNDPPDDAERLRNDRIYSIYQHNRNPFIDHPEYVNLIYAPVSNGNTVTVSSTNRAGTSIGVGASYYPLLSINLTANAAEWDLGAMSFAKLGTVPDGDVTALRLYRDNDNDGTVSAGDVLLDTRTFSAGSATFSLGTPSRVTTTGASFLIVASLSATAANGNTFGVQVSAVTSAASGGTDTNPVISPPLGSTLATVSGGVTNGDTLSVSFVDRAGTTVSAGAADFPLVSVSLTANSNEWDLASIGVTEQGSISDAQITALKLFLDADGNGQVSTGDTLLDTRVLSGGSATFALSPAMRITTTQKSLLVAATVSAAVTNGATLQLRVEANSILSSSSGGSDTNPNNSEFLSTVATVEGGITDGNSVTVSATGVAPVSAVASTQDVGILGVTLTANANEWDLGTMAITRLGTLADSGVTAVKLYSDVDGDGAVSGVDALLATTTFASGSATFNVSGGILRVTETATKLLVAADISDTALHGATLGVQLEANGIASSPSGGLDQNPTFAAVPSNLSQVKNLNLGTVKIVMVSTEGSYLPGGSGYREFVVLANHSPSAINLNGWELRMRGGGDPSDRKSLLAGTIPGHGHFLIGAKEYAGNVEGVAGDYQDIDMNGIAGGMSNDKGRSIALFNGTGTGATKIDGFSFNGGATDPNGLHEGTPFVGASGSTTVSFARKRPGGTTGYYTDTDNNVNDLENVTSKTPSNSLDINVPVTLSHVSFE